MKPLGDDDGEQGGIALGRRPPRRGEVAALGAAGLLLCGCIFAPIENSCDVDSDLISMEAHVVDNGKSVRAAADFRIGPRGDYGALLRLCDEDKLTINGVAATETVKPSKIEYVVTWDPDQAPTDYEIVLDRGDDRVVAKVTMPPTLSILMPTMGQAMSRSADFEVQWQPSREGSNILLRVFTKLAGPCDEDAGGPDYARGVELPDNGVATILAHSFVPDNDFVAGESCEATVELGRSHGGDYPAGLEPSGTIEASVERTLEFLLVP